MAIWLTIVNSVLAASSSVLVISGVGALLYKFKHIDEKFLSQLSQLIETILLPSLIVTNFIKSVTIEQFWIVLPPVCCGFLQSFLGWAVADISNLIIIKDARYANLVRYSCANPHVTNIQLQVCYGLSILLEELSKLRGFETSEDTYTRAITAIMIFTVASNTFRWTIGKSFLIKFSQDQIQYENLLEMVPIDGNDKTPSQIDSHKQLLSKPAKTIKSTDSVWQQFVSPPFLSIAGGCFIICIPPLQKMLVEQQYFLNRALFAPIYTVGKASPPCMMIMLGANIASIIMRGGFKEGQSVNNRVLTLITFTRLFLLPLVGLPLTLVLAKIGFLIDPCHIFITFFSFATPQAVNLLSQSRQHTNQEDVVAAVLLYTYLTAIVTLPIWSIIFFFIMFV